MPKNNKYYFEFVGAHGAGKTLTYHAITKQNLLSPHIAIYPGQVRRPKLHFSLSWPFIAVKNFNKLMFVFIFFLKYTAWSPVNFRVLRSLLKMVVLHPYYERFGHDVLLKDDMLHMLQRIVFRPNTDIFKAIDSYFLTFAYRYNGLIFVNISPEIMWDRFKRRFPGKSENFREVRRVIHERALNQSQVLRQVITTQKAVPYLILDGGDDPSQNAAKVVSFIKSILREPR